MNGFLFRYFIAFCCGYFLLAKSASAALSDYYPDFVEFGSATVLNEVKTASSDEFRLPLDTLKRQNGRMEPKKYLSMQGERHRLTYEIGRDHSSEVVFRYFMAYFASQKFEVLYECISLKCGSSSDWANKFFKQRVLNGFDESQHYVSLRSSTDDSERYIALYVVQSANKKNFVHIIVITPNEAQTDAAGIVANLLAKGYVALPDIHFSQSGQLDLESSQSDLNAMLSWLQKNPDRKTVLVVSSSLRSDVDLALRETKNAADQVLYELGKKVDTPRLTAYGIGPLAPSKSQRSTVYGHVDTAALILSG